MGGCKLILYGSKYGPETGSGEHGHEILCYTKWGRLNIFLRQTRPTLLFVRVTTFHCFVFLKYECRIFSFRLSLYLRLGLRNILFSLNQVVQLILTAHILHFPWMIQDTHMSGWIWKKSKEMSLLKLGLHKQNKKSMTPPSWMVHNN